MSYISYNGTYIYLKGLWEGLSEVQLREHGLFVTDTPPLQPFVEGQSQKTTKTGLNPFGNMKFSQIEDRFHR